MLKFFSNFYFRPEKYHLFDHNCNTFSDESAQFLTGRKIPSYIVDLPSEVQDTPIGAMLRSMMDSVRGPLGGQRYYSGEPYELYGLQDFSAPSQNPLSQGSSSQNEPPDESRERYQ